MNFAVGKKIGGSVYVHRRYERQFPGVKEAKSHLPRSFKYHVVKYDTRSGAFSFIISEDFDTNPEPSMQGGIRVGDDIKVLRDAGWIYHHKWMFVGDDYKGFDIAVSKARSAAWTSLKNVNKAKIGQRKYWNTITPRIK
jgi:hypothetical protein